MTSSSKQTFKIFDKNFSPARSCSWLNNPSQMEWQFLNPNDELHENDVIFYTDSFLPLSKTHRVKKKIAWLLEPPAIRAEAYRYILENYRDFDLILTYSKELLDVDSRFVFYPNAMSWIREHDFGLFHKSQMTSIIVSSKNKTEGHKLRHKIVSDLRPHLDVFGKGYQPIPYKLDALRDYRFTVAIENSRLDYYFSEKLLDCFATGVVPIYWGCPSIGKFFDERGMIVFQSPEELKNILANLTEEDYSKRSASIQANLNLSKEYRVTEDWIYQHTNIKDLK